MLLFVCLITFGLIVWFGFVWGWLVDCVCVLFAWVCRCCWLLRCLLVVLFVVVVCCFADLVLYWLVCLGFGVRWLTVGVCDGFGGLWVCSFGFRAVSALCVLLVLFVGLLSRLLVE